MARYFKFTVHSSQFTVISLALALTLTFPFISCQEGSEAGDLLGQWRMTDSDTKYVSFSGSIALFRCINKGELFGNFQHVGDSLFIQCYSINENPDDYAIVEDDFGMKPHDNIRVKIEALDSDHLVLSKNGQYWNFYKY